MTSFSPDDRDFGLARCHWKALRRVHMFCFSPDDRDFGLARRLALYDFMFESEEAR